MCIPFECHCIPVIAYLSLHTVIEDRGIVFKRVNFSVELVGCCWLGKLTGK